MRILLFLLFVAFAAASASNETIGELAHKTNNAGTEKFTTSDSSESDDRGQSSDDIHRLQSSYDGDKNVAHKLTTTAGGQTKPTTGAVHLAELIDNPDDLLLANLTLEQLDRPEFQEALYEVLKNVTQNMIDNIRSLFTSG